MTKPRHTTVLPVGAVPYKGALKFYGDPLMDFLSWGKDAWRGHRHDRIQQIDASKQQTEFRAQIVLPKGRGSIRDRARSRGESLNAAVLPLTSSWNGTCTKQRRAAASVQFMTE